MALTNRKFLICAVVLVAMAIGKEPASEAMAAWLKKRPVDVRKPLAQFDRTCLEGFDFTDDQSEGKAEGLETLEYIYWEFQPGIPDFSFKPAMYLNINYYTVTPQRVNLNIPHTPEVCFRQGGNRITEMGAIEIPTDGIPTLDGSLEAKYLRMTHPTNVTQKDIVVAYLLYANGRFFDDREKARVILGLPWNRDVYFTKIEVMTTVPAPNRLDDALEACRRMLEGAIAELLDKHLPAP
ncbi:MAG: hypothetical protein CMJ18_03980 [Phycisphaeraceae bacterium]|nr:hypothetical protein [Phycisphaeraceae bacterium]